MTTTDRVAAVATTTTTMTTKTHEGWRMRHPSS